MSQETMNVFWSDLIRMLSKLNYFKFMQIGYLRWPPGVITNNSKNKKIPICKESLNKIDPTVFFFFFFFCMKLLRFLAIWYSKMVEICRNLNCTNMKNDNISIPA